MKKVFFLFVVFISSAVGVNAQFKKDGSPDMRFKSNKQLNDNSYSSPTYNYGTNQDVRYQNGYYKKNGTYVEPYNKTSSNNTNLDNFSTKDNYNNYNEKVGTKAKDYSDEAQNYGKGKTIYIGPNGGQYYFNSNGDKIYVPKR